MIFPRKTHDILQHFLINLTTTDINSKVFVLMIGFQQLGYGVDWIPVKFLYPWCRESHGNDPWSYVSQI